YHRRREGSRACSEWERVGPSRYAHLHKGIKKASKADSSHPARAISGAYVCMACRASLIEQTNGLISTARLRALQRLHLPPIYLVVFQKALMGNPYLRACFALRCVQRLITAAHSYPALRRAAQQVHQQCVHSGPLVLGTALVKLPTPTVDRDRTVSRRSEPSSRTALIGEQPNPWDLLQPQDAMNRHRGAKPPRRCELLGEISLLSPEYLLSFERRPFHVVPPDH